MERKLTAILSADVKGYSRLMGEDEEGTIRTLTAYREVMTTLIAQHRGRVVDSPGDNLLAEFASAVDAVQGAVEIQRELKVRNAELPDPRRMEFRIGINVGDVVVEGERLYGDGVNIAARLEGLAEPGGICISGTVYDQVENKLALGYEYVGEQAVKNIAKPVRVFRILLEPDAVSDNKSVLRHAQHERASTPVTLSLSKGDRQPWLAAPRFRTALVLAGLLLIIGVTAFLFLSPLSTQDSALRTQAAPAALPLPDKPSIAVLPFTNMSGDPEQEYFSDGITEDLITDFSKISGLLVIARNSTFVYKGKAVKIEEVSKDLGVRYVLEGSVRKADNKVRITAQLVDGTTGGHLWAESYDRELKDIFALQDEITQQIMAALKVKMLQAELDRVRRIPTANLTAYDSLLRGVEYFSRTTKEANAQARQLCERAIELDPQYADAYALLGFTHWLDWDFHWNRDPQTLAQAFAMTQKAIALDDSLPPAHMALSLVSLSQGQPEQAIAEAERAIALDPNNADGHWVLGVILNAVGRPAEALEVIQKAMRLNPHTPFSYSGSLGRAYRLTGQHAEAIAALKQALVRNPNFLIAHLDLAESYLAQWDRMQTQDPQVLERALESAQKAVALSESLPWGHFLLARVYLSKKQHAQALAEAERVIALVPNEADGYALRAAILNYAGQPEQAIAVMEQALHLNPHPPAWYFYHLGQAYRLTGRMEEAITTLKRALTQDPDIWDTYYDLVVLYRELGREEEARATVTEIRRRAPHVSLEVLKQPLVYKDPAEVERMLVVLRKAGLE
jgi:adenylate cyclase